jgi:hypothetical protein
MEVVKYNLKAKNAGSKRGPNFTPKVAFAIFRPGVHPTLSVDGLKARKSI